MCWSSISPKKNEKAVYHREMKSLYLQQWAKNVGEKLSLRQGIAPSLGGNRGRIESKRSGRTAEVGAPAQASPHVLTWRHYAVQKSSTRQMLSFPICSSTAVSLFWASAVFWSLLVSLISWSCKRLDHWKMLTSELLLLTACWHCLRSNGFLMIQIFASLPGIWSGF